MPRRYRQPKRVPFLCLSRGRRSEAVVLLKNAMRHHVAQYGGLFDSHHQLDGENANPAQQWIDFEFPSSRDRFTLWNAELITSQLAFWDTVHELATSRAMVLLSDAEKEALARIEWKPAQRLGNGKILSFEMVFPEDDAFPQFGGLTYDQYVEKLEQEIARQEPPVVHESFSLDPGYAYGIGLSIVIDAPHVSRVVVEEAIARFRREGERNWRSPSPVPRERLSMVSHKEANAAWRAAEQPSEASAPASTERQEVLQAKWRESVTGPQTAHDPAEVLDRLEAKYAAKVSGPPS